MNYQNRYLFDQVQQDLAKKMVFLAGPRQVGKTTFAKFLLGKQQQAGYLNWDIAAHREKLLKQQLPPTDFWVLDEIHKYKSWRNYLKGLYDQFHEDKKILVTGSARLDLYRRGGDSLQGRYHFLRLYPFTVAELAITKQKDYEQLLKLSGFPEPFLSSSAVDAKRWSRDYRQRLIQEDLLSLEPVHDVGNLELLMLRLPALVGSPLSLNNLREDLQVSHHTIDKWIEIFCKLYAVFKIAPLGSPGIRAIKKAQKHYHFDWSLVTQAGPRFENLVAVHLLKWVHYEQDTQARNVELRYFRDNDGREVDFVITEDDQPIYAIECKVSDDDISKHLNYFKRKFPQCEAWQLTSDAQAHFISKDGIHCAQAMEFLKKLI